MNQYDHKKIEKKWQQRWASEQLYESSEDKGKSKMYVLDMFPYPSGEGLHVGHPKGYIATDIYSRMKRMQGYSVLHPMGWDAFGLPAENFAIKTKTHPRIAVEKNVARYKAQLSNIGLDYDWSREINTTDPGFYKWTQWIFLRLFEKGLAYQSNEPINWCPSCQTGLANEDLEQGRCERCGSAVELRPMRQWVLKITDYADRLLNDLEELPDWPEHIKEQQRNWIGRSEGAEIDFPIAGSDHSITVFTTRPDTLFGATYMVLAPEHPLVEAFKDKIENWDEVYRYIDTSIKRTEVERTAEGKEKTGVELKGVRAINPANKKEIPIFVADYVLAHYGTGAIMAVPAHDERDFAFAKKFSLSIEPVIFPAKSIGNFATIELGNRLRDDVNQYKKYIEEHGAFVGDGHLINSGKFDGNTDVVAQKKITEYVNGQKRVTYKLREWVFSRQRYWGEPIPIIHCEKCAAVPVPEEDLPVVLPEVEHYEPAGTGESPLANIEEWVNVPCPKCNGAGKRETNTMPQWAGSSWYYLRFMDPKNDTKLVSSDKEKYWAPVDLYVGGAEHATRHLIYARFWHKFLHDIGVVNTSEPFTRLHSVGLIHAEDGRKMSKRYGNVINPDDVIERFGADSFRTYEMFMGPFGNAIDWSTDNLVGVRRFIERVWRSAELIQKESVPELESSLNRAIKKVGDDIEAFKFNTAVSQMMIFINEIEERDAIGFDQFARFLKILAPFAPHIADELWEGIGGEGSIHTARWPDVDESKLVAETVAIAVQVNGKLRGTLEIDRDMEEQQVCAEARKLENVSKWLAGKTPDRTVYKPGKLVNFVVQ